MKTVGSRNNLESRNKWFRSEVGAAFAVGATVAGIIIYFMAPVNKLNTDFAVLSQTLSDLKNNDFTHIELEITQEQQSVADMQKVQIAQGIQITQALTILQTLTKK